MRVILHHTPKSGGTYVLQVLQHAGYTHKRVPWSDPRAGRAIIGCNYSASLFSSHHAFHPGVFTPKRGEYYITWVRNPVDMAYSAWHYYSSNPQALNNARPPHLFTRIGAHDTPEGYIDAMLASKAPFFPEGVYTGLDLSRFDYVGSAERMDESLRGLLEMLGRFFAGGIVGRVNQSGATYTYRRAELGERLAPEMEAVEPWL